MRWAIERDDELRQLREKITKLSPSDNKSASRDTELVLNPLAGGKRNARDVRGPSCACPEDLGFKLKPDVFDGSASLYEFLAQFELVSYANGWDDHAKSAVLA